MVRAEFIKSLREGLLLSTKDVEGRAKLPAGALAAIEGGSRDPSIDELEAIARTLGLHGETLFEEDVASSGATDVLRLLFKSAEGLSPPPEARLQMLDAARAALDLLEFQDQLKAPPPLLPPLQLPRVANETIVQLAGRQATKVRFTLQLGKAPVPSLRDLVTIRLRIPLIAAQLGAHGPDAFSVFAPGGRIAIVLNVDGKHQNLLVRRFTLAHEIGHVFADKPNQGGRGLACLIDSQRELDVETRANAFAIRLLLSSEVDKFKGQLLEPGTFRHVMEHWGIHFRALRLFTKNLLGLSDEAMAREAPNVDTSTPLHIRDAEELEAERSAAIAVPLPRRGELARLVLQSFSSGGITSGRVRELLRIDASVDLEELAQSVA